MAEHDGKFAERDGGRSGSARKRFNSQRGHLWPECLAYADLAQGFRIGTE